MAKYFRKIRHNNEYGICHCEQCSLSRKGNNNNVRATIKKYKKRLRKYYKGGNKKPKKGYYSV